MLYQIQNNRLALAVDSRGAEMKALRGADGTRYLWEGDTQYWRDSSPLLFPYVARLQDGMYWMDGKTYRMDIHGFAKDSLFRAERLSSCELQFTLADSPASLQQYPRRFRLTVGYRLEEVCAVISLLVENRDSRPMFFGLGLHPGFRVPLTDGLSFEDYRLRFDAACAPARIGFTPELLRSGECRPFPLKGGVLPLSHRLFDEDAVVLSGCGHRVCLESPRDSHRLTVDFPEMDYLGIWHVPGTDAPYVCLEPWACLPALAGQPTVLEEQPDLLKLAPGESLERSVTIRVE